MGVHDENAAQAEFWTVAGSRWVAQRERFDDQAGDHGIAAIDRLAPVTGERVIDVGCGAGSTTLQLASRVGPTGQVHGLDISPTMVDGAAALARRLDAGNVTFSVGDATVEAFDGGADAVYSRFGVMFFADATAAFANMRTALRPGGRIGFTCWQPPSVNPWVTQTLEVGARHVEMPFGADPTAPGPFSLGDPDRVRGVLTGAGFADVDVQANEAMARLGETVEDAVAFLMGLIPAAAGLEENDPAAAQRLRDDLEAVAQGWLTDEGVRSPSATWIVHAVNPGG